MDTNFYSFSVSFIVFISGTTHQCGVLAAAGLIGLNNLSQIATDNANAKLLAIGLNTVNGITVVEPESNLVYLNCAVAASKLVVELEKKHVLCFALGDDMIRMVTHLEIKEKEIDEIVGLVNICCGIVMEMGVEDEKDGKDGKEEEYGSWNTN